MDFRFVDDLLVCFVSNAHDQDFVILIDPHDPGQFVQFMRRGAAIYAELSSRQWEGGGRNRPLADEAELGLMRMGFTHGGRAKNYAQDGLIGDGPFLAHVARSAFATAYGTPMSDRPIVASTVRIVRAWVMAAGGVLQPMSGPTDDVRGFFCALCELSEPFGGGCARPGLLNRARRSASTSFVRVHLDCEDHVVFVRAVREAETFDKLPEQVQDWIMKSEEGPLFR